HVLALELTRPVSLVRARRSVIVTRARGFGLTVGAGVGVGDGDAYGGGGGAPDGVVFTVHVRSPVSQAGLEPTASLCRCSVTVAVSESVNVPCRTIAS